MVMIRVVCYAIATPIGLLLIVGTLLGLLFG
jgi:hypothetical protein